jgi:hypothetical protein
MLHKQRYFDRNGREVAEHEAMRAGVLRDGFSLRIPTTLRDSRFADARQLWDSGRLVVTDLDSTAGSGNRPGFRVLDCPVNRQAVHDAYVAYVNDLENAWRNPLRLGDAAPPPDPDERDDDDERSQGKQVRPVTADAIANHQRNMARIYDAYAAELSSAWMRK